MAQHLTAEDARQSLTSHVASKGAEIFARYGSNLGWDELNQILSERTWVRYPCSLVFDSAHLLEGEFAHPEPNGASPEDGFTMRVHPIFQLQLRLVPALVLYQLVAVNYGEFASAEDAECFGAAALGLSRDDYYALLCDASDQLSDHAGLDDGMEAHACSSGSGCHCGS